MKIAIMTQPLGKNYGGIMQAWALQKVLKNAGHDPVTIDRQPDAKSPAYYTARFGYRALQQLLGKRKAPISFERYLPLILQQTNRFIEQYLKMSELLDSTAKLSKHFESEQYDAVIVGSDQTWRPCYSPNIGNFFLDFLQGNNIRRIAYATSFGVDKWEFSEEETRRCTRLVKHFEAVSVRESSGVDLCKKHLDVDAFHVLDPTLLLGRRHYETLYRVADVPAKQGICTYVLDEDKWKSRVVDAVKSILKEDEYRNQPKASLTDLASSKDFRDYIMPSLESWVRGFSDASFVVTDSFHGTVFSIIFNKPFITLVNPNRGASRLYSLLSDLGLGERAMEQFDEDKIIKLLGGGIDFREANERLEFLKRRSASFLENSLGSKIEL
ncbi:polysaccharide pyruvyl transferase family protein [Pseudomonas sp. FIP_A4]|uniref:polysaccharide pyruvyl transferase family protein n=1 Tax=Pseudomonas sp. FIP_A4 TaxID=3070684 RepID=UPI002FD4001F